MPAYVIAEMNWVDFADAARRTDLCIIPVGAVEVYGPHLPQGADGLLANHLARAAAERLSCFVAPLIPVGFSHHFQEFPGTLSIPTAALRGYTAGVAESLLQSGCHQLVFFNGHLGNVAVISDLVQDLRRRHSRGRFTQVDLWRFLLPLAAPLMESPFPQGHAGEICTSVLLALVPDLVKMERAVNNPPPADRYPEIIKYESYRAIAPDGAVGDATKGNAEKGREALRRGVERLVQFLQESGFCEPDRTAGKET